MNRQTSLVKNVFLLLTAFVFFSCGALQNPTYTAGEEAECYVGIYAEVKNSEGTDILFSSSSSRTILPERFGDEDNLTFQLTGKNANNKSISIDIDPDNPKAILSYTVWNLTLTAYLDEGKTKPVLIGTTTVDLTNGASEIPFTLTEGNLTTVGTVKLSGTYTPADAGASKMTATLNNLITGQVEYELCSGQNISAGTFDIAKKENVAPGSYFLLLTFFNDSGTEMGNWGDTLIVDPGNDTEKDDIAVTLNTAPAKLAHLSAYEIKSSEVTDVTATNVDKFQVLIEWEASDKMAKQFNLVVTETDGEGSTTEYFNSQTAVGSANASIVVGGSLFGASRSCVIELPTGRLFDISMTASNKIGTSEAMSKEDSDKTTDTTYGELVNYGADEKINLVRVAFSLNNGTYYEGASTESNKTKKGVILKYFIYQDEDKDLSELLPVNKVADTSSFTAVEGPALLSSDKRNWEQWVLSDKTTVVESTAERRDGSNVVIRYAFQNLYVVASYDTSSTLNINYENFNDLSDDNVVYSLGHLDELVIMFDSETAISGNAVTVDVGTLVSENHYDALYMKLELRDPDSEYDFTNYVFYVDNNQYSYGEETCVIELTELDTGIHNVVVNAYDQNTTAWYGYRITLTLE